MIYTDKYRGGHKNCPQDDSAQCRCNHFFSFSFSVPFLNHLFILVEYHIDSLHR
nr:MAG TPA: hypothetical protein [Caudoviricetes sp.]